MKTIENELIISDEEFEAYKIKMKNLSELIENKLALLVKELRIVCYNGITEGNVHDNLRAFVSVLEEMEGQLTFFTEEMGSDAVKFDQQVEMLDCEFNISGGE